MASISSFTLILISIALFALQVTSYPLDNICRQTKNPDLCSKLLGPHSNETLQELDRLMIVATTANVTLTGAKIVSFLSQTKDQDLRIVYTLCSNYYRSALVALNGAQANLKSGKYRDVNAAADTVSRDVASCKEAFAKAPSKFIPIARDNNNVDLLSNVFAVISKILTGFV